MDIDREAIIQTFLAETDEGLAAMEQALVALESQGEDEELLGTIFRVAHTLKGNAASLGFDAVAEFAHAVEDVLDRVREGTTPVTSPLVTSVLGCVDALREMVPAAVAGSEEMAPRHRTAVKRLRRAAGSGSRSRAKRTVVAEARASERRRGAGRRAEDVVGSGARDKTLRVDIERLDRLLNLTGELVISRGRLRQVLESGTGAELAAALEVHGETERLYVDLQELVMQIRMVSVGPTLRRYARTVRDLAEAHGKQAHLVLEGEEVEVDTKVVEHIQDPLTHMIRNALDHGIEPPEVRKASGKNPCGQLVLRAYHDAGSVVIQLADDGAGFDRERIVERARSLGNVAEPERLTEQDLYRLAMEPGFSTAETVTDLSGRGVGMDVVRRNIEALRGSVGIESRRGEGTTITIRLPLTLAIIDGFVVGVGEETYVMAMDTVVECLELSQEERRHPDGRGVINLRGEPLPYLQLQSLFGLRGTAAKRQHVVVVQHNGFRAGLAVDVLHGASQTVIKHLGTLFQGLSGISGSAILGTGRVALILDVPTLLRELVGREAQRVGRNSETGAALRRRQSANEAEGRRDAAR